MVARVLDIATFDETDSHSNVPVTMHALVGFFEDKERDDMLGYVLQLAGECKWSWLLHMTTRAIIIFPSEHQSSYCFLLDSNAALWDSRDFHWPIALIFHWPVKEFNFWDCNKINWDLYSLGFLFFQCGWVLGCVLVTLTWSSRQRCLSESPCLQRSAYASLPCC